MVIPYLFRELELWIGFTKVWHIFQQSVNLFLNIIFSHWSHFLRNFWEASKNKTHGMILILTLARGNGCGQICGHSTILGQRGWCLRSFLNSCWWVVAGDGWQMTPGPKIPKMYLYCFGLFFGLPIKFTETFFCSATWKNHHDLDFHIYIYIYIKVPQKTWDIL